MVYHRTVSMRRETYERLRSYARSRGMTIAGSLAHLLDGVTCGARHRFVVDGYEGCCREVVGHPPPHTAVDGNHHWTDPA